MQSRTPLVLACSLGMLAWQSEAAERPRVATPLDTVVVTATQSERLVGDVATTVSVVDAEEIERRNARSLKDLVRYEPGLSVRNDGARFGLAGLSIRGLDGNRVAMEVDGTPVADAFAIGSFSNAGRDAVDLDILKQVEIVRGPASALHGSDSLAGIVGFVTQEPLDLLDGTVRGMGRVRMGYDSVDRSRQATATLAGRHEAWSGLMLISHLQGEARANDGRVVSLDASRTVPNPQDTERRSMLGKLLFDVSESQQFKLTVDAMRGETATDVVSARRTQASGPNQVRTDALHGFDETERDRVALDYRLRPATVFDDVQVKAYQQRSLVQQATVERRTTIAASGQQTPQQRDRRFEFAQDTEGFEVVATRDIDLGTTRHAWVFGSEWQRTDSDQLRDGLQTHLGTGATTPVIGPDAFPVRDFPPSTTRELAFYVQDAISWSDGRFELMPGLRWDSIRLDAQADAIFTADNPGVAIVDVDHQKVSPRVAASFRLVPNWSLHAQWAEGFRAPPYGDVNIGFTNLQFGYTARPNPDLRPESSHGMEVGVRVRGEAGFAALTAYDNDYRDFIESFVNLGVDPTTGLLVFQSQNIADVAIRGVELRATLNGDALHTTLSGWQLDAALARASGEDRTHDTALASVDPARATLGIGYTTPSGRWDLTWVSSSTRRQDRTDDRFGTAFRAPGYTAHDLIGQWRLTDRMRLSASVLNLLDHHYWEWADVRGRLASDSTLDRYSAPGRTANLGLTVEI